MPTIPILRPIAGLLLLVTAATPAVAEQYGQWSPGWGRYGTSLGVYSGRSGIREGKVTAARFVANDPRVSMIGHGPISATAGIGDMMGPGERSMYEAAVLDRLAANGYAVNVPAGTGQVAEIVVEHYQLTPAELPRSPVSGGVSIGGGIGGGGYRGSYTGVGIGIDLRKPKKALIGTRLQVRIRDASDKAILWEGRADIATREGDKKWTPDMIARKLTTTLFEGFPTAN